MASPRDGPWTGQTSMFPKGEPMQGLELSPFETSAGDILVLDRPASSPWMWESWALGTKGAAFGPKTRGPFPLYACFDASVTTSSGVLMICGRFPAISCQLSFDHGMSWKLWTIDISGTTLLRSSFVNFI